MAAAGFGTSPFILPNAFQAPGEVLGGIIQDKRQDKQIADQTAYRQRKDAEADQWKKLGLIQDLTDLSKHQTGSDVANAVGNQQASAILQKYTQEAPNMSPNELMAKVQKDMSGLVSGMDAMKNELEMSDEQLKLLKQAYPELDITSMAKTYRADILNRRMKGNDFVNPLEVTPTQLDLSNPDILSRFITGNKNLSESIINPKGAEPESVLMGKQGDYTKFEGKVPFWKAPTYDRNKYIQGFYPGKEIPSLKIRSSVLPSDAMPSSNGKPFEIIDEDVYKRFSEDGKTNLELIAATRNRFPDYDKFTETEKDYAKRNVLFETIKSLDNSQLIPTANVRPQVTSIRNYSGGTKEPGKIDLREYKDVSGGKDVTDLFRGVKVTGLPNGSSLLAESVVYNPTTQQVTYKEYTDGQNAQPKTVSLTKFFQDIKTLNPQIDMKFLEGLRNPITGATPSDTKPDVRLPKDIKQTKMTTKPKKDPLGLF